VGDVDHDVANSDDRYPVADPEVALAELGETIVMVDEILRVADTRGSVTGNAEGLGPLGASRDDDCRRLENLRISSIVTSALAPTLR
jgi:hypothetical protein